MTEQTELMPCPFCGAGQTYMHVNKGPWNGIGHGEPVSVEVRHWCADVPGQLSRMIAVAGRDGSSAIAAWNRRTPQPTQAQAGAVPMTDEQKHARNPYRHSRGAASVWMAGFEAAELWYRIGIKGGQHG